MNSFQDVGAVAAEGLPEGLKPAFGVVPTAKVENGVRVDASRLSHLQLLEAESIQIFREVAAEFQKPVMLYSIGKDSSVMLRLAQKAFFSRATSLSSAACRYRIQVSRDDRVSRRPCG